MAKSTLVPNNIKKIEKALLKVGFTKTDGGKGGHVKYVHPGYQPEGSYPFVTVPHHGKGTLSTGVYRQILKAISAVS